MKRILAIAFLVGAVLLGYYGFTLYQDATAGATILGFDISLSDQEGKQAALYHALGAVVCLLVGGYLWRS